MGWAVPLQSLLWWPTQKVCTGRGRHQDYRTMPLITIWRTLCCILHSFKDLTKRILLANHVWRHERLHQEMWSMSEAWEYQFTRCHATHQQPSDRAFRWLGNRLHGPISKVKAMSTSWWQLTMSPSGLKPCHVGLLMQRTPRRCLKRQYFHISEFQELWLVMEALTSLTRTFTITC